MAEPKDKGRTYLRDLVAQPDAVNETMRVSGMGPERMA